MTKTRNTRNIDDSFTPQGISPDTRVAFTCLGSECPNTCCGPFHGTRALHSALTSKDLGKPLGDENGDQDAAAISLFAQIRLTGADVKRLQDAGLDHLIVRRGALTHPTYYMKLRPDGTCQALSENHLCTIHPHRPTICRAFPFYIDLFAGLSMVSSCPGVGGVSQPLSKLREEIEAATAMYEFWASEMRKSR